MVTRAVYPSDLTDKQWAEIEPLIPAAESGGRDREVNMREVLNGILYLVRGGVSWRMLPHDLPPWGTVHYYYRRFRLDGTWVKIHDTLRGRVRKRAGRKVNPSAGIMDSHPPSSTFLNTLPKSRFYSDQPLDVAFVAPDFDQQTGAIRQITPEIQRWETGQSEDVLELAVVIRGHHFRPQPNGHRRCRPSWRASTGAL